MHSVALAQANSEISVLLVTKTVAGGTKAPDFITGTKTSAVIPNEEGRAKASLQ